MLIHPTELSAWWHFQHRLDMAAGYALLAYARKVLFRPTADVT